MSRRSRSANVARSLAVCGPSEFMRQNNLAVRLVSLTSRHRRMLATASLLALALGAAAPARAQTAWTGTTSTDWFIAGNWSAGVPTGGVNTTIDTITPNPTVVGAAGAQASTLFVGFSSTGNLTIQNGGTSQAKKGTVGSAASSSLTNGSLVSSSSADW